MAPDLASLQRISGDSAIDQWLQVQIGRAHV